MRIIPKQLAALASVGAFASVGLFASALSPARIPAGHQDRLITEIETVLAMTPAQKDQTQTAVQEARQAATPIRQDLMSTNRALRAAVRSDDTAQIQRLSTTEGQEIGQLLAIRSTAVSKVYKTLTPEQKVKADALRALMMHEMQQQVSNSRARS